MTDRLTEKEIEEIRERAEAATEEPWVKWVSGPEVFSGVTKNEPGSISHEEQICRLDDFMRDASQVDDDARFIAHARTDIPRLLDEVERLREERDRYRRDIKSALERIDTPRLLEEARDHDVQMAANKMRRMLNE